MSKGKLIFRYGAMNSGKSTNMLMVCKNYEDADKQVVVMTPSRDSRGGGLVTSRLGVSRKADYVVTPNMNLEFILGTHIVSKGTITCVLIDEIQFLTESQINQLREASTLYDITVICYGLRADFKNIAFPSSARLLTIADNIEELKTICSCGSKAQINARFIGSDLVLEGPQVLIESESSNITYKSLCPKCYYGAKYGAGISKYANSIKITQ